MKRYRLEITGPADYACLILIAFDSDAPFLPIRRGDLINLQGLPISASEVQRREIGNVLRVIGIEHGFTRDSADGCQHRLFVHTEEMKDRTPFPAWNPKQGDVD